MTRISQLIAVVGGVSAEADTRLAALANSARNEAVMDGHEKTYEPLDEDSGVQLPPKFQKVRLTASTVLQRAAAVLTHKWDTGRTLDQANSNAYASVTVGGAELLADVPVGHLLYLEKELAVLQALVDGLPVLKQTKDWSTEGAEPGQHRSAAVKTTSTDKVFFNHRRGNGTANFQEQVDVLTRDEVVGYWTTVDFSGALSPRRKATLLNRVSELRDAVKMAREEANASQVEDVKEGQVIFDWLLRP